MGYIHVEILSANNLKRLFLTHKKLFLGTKIMALYLGIKNIGHLYKEQVRQKKKKNDIHRCISTRHKLPSWSLAQNKKTAKPAN